MSNRDKIKESLKNFVIEKKYDVAILKGDWGIGKTFLWKEIELDILNTYKEESFIYVSLFGLKNTEEIKNKLIFQGNSEEKTVKMFENIKDSKPFGVSSSIITAPLSLFFELAMENRLKNKIIVFDDIERKNEGLDILSLLGLINELKYKKNQIIIMLNEEKIHISLDKKWQIFKEKIIDIEYRLEISSMDCFNIVTTKINQDKYSLLDNISKEIMRSTIINLEIKNIRIANLIFKRMYDILIEITQILTTENKNVFENIMKNIAKIFYIYFNTDNTVNYEKLFKYLEKNCSSTTRIQNMYLNTYSHEKNVDEEEINFTDLLGDLEFNLDLNITKIISNYIKTGFLEKENLNQIFLKISKEFCIHEKELNLVSFIKNLQFNNELQIKDIEFQIDFFSEGEYINYNFLYDLYLLLKKIKHTKQNYLLDKLENKIKENKWTPNPSILKESEKLRLALINNNVDTNLINLEITELIKLYSDEQDQIDNILNNLTIKELKEKLLKEKDLELIIKFMNDTKSAERLNKFTINFNKIYEDLTKSTNPDYIRLKQILLLTYKI